MEAVPDDELERINREIARIESEDISAHPIGYLMGWADWQVERLLVLEERKQKEMNLAWEIALKAEASRLEKLVGTMKDSAEDAWVSDEVVLSAISRIPPSWSMIRRVGSGGYFRRGTLQAGVTVARYQDGNVWLHVSVCGRKGKDDWYIPSWEEMSRAKNDLIGNKWAYQVMPPPKDYVNVNPYCLHIFARLDGTSVLPDFTWGLKSI